MIRHRLAGVDADPHSQTLGRFGAVRRKAPLDVGCGAYRVRHLIERSHYSVAGVLYLASTVRGKSAPDKSIVHAHQLERRGVAEACRHLGRANDVGEHDGPQPGTHFRRSGTREPAGIANAAKECLYRSEIDRDDF